jgi:hypothetical protein
MNQYITGDINRSQIWSVKAKQFCSPSLQSSYPLMCTLHQPANKSAHTHKKHRARIQKRLNIHKHEKYVESKNSELVAEKQSYQVNVVFV